MNKNQLQKLMNEHIDKSLNAWWETEPFGFDHPDTFAGIRQLMVDSYTAALESDTVRGLIDTLKIYAQKPVIGEDAKQALKDFE